MKEKKNIKIVVSMMFINLISRILSFLKLILLGSKFGTTYITDAYILSESIPMMLFGLIIGAVNTSFIPVYSKVKIKEGKNAALLFTNRVLIIIVFIAMLLSMCGILFTNEIISIVGKGFNDKTTVLAVNFTKILIPTIIFTGIVQVFIGYLQANHYYLSSIIYSIPLNTIIIFALLMSRQFGIHGVVIATIVGSIAQVLVLIPSLKKSNFSFKICFNFYDKWIIYMMKLVIPVLVGSGIYQLNIFFDRMLASGLEEGSISALNFAFRLSEFAMGIITIAITTFVYPNLSFLVNNNMKKFKNTIISSLNIIILLVTPIMATIILLRIPIVNILFERGAFSRSATEKTAGVLLFYSFGMIFSSIRYIVTRIFYSMHDTKTSMLNGTISLIINIILNFILVNYMGADGLALATSISAFISAVLLLYNLKIKLGDFNSMRILITLVKVIVATFIMSIIMYVMRNTTLMLFLNSEMYIKIILLVFICLISVVLYIILVFLFKIEELNRISILINKKISYILFRKK